MSQFLALLSGAMWGIADFSGGLGSRRIGSYRFTAWAQLASVPVLMVGVFLVKAEELAARDLAIGAVAGLLGLVGLFALYSALAAGTMSTVAPITGVLTVGIPMVWGIATGDSITRIQWLGIAAAIVGILLIARDHEHAKLTKAVAVQAVVASLGFAGFYVVLDLASDGAGLWPILAARAATIPAAFVVAFVMTKSIPRPTRSVLPFVVGTGFLDATANFLILRAIQTGPISIAVVLNGLFPVFTTIAAIVFLAERPTRSQLSGIALAITASVLLLL